MKNIICFILAYLFFAINATSHPNNEWVNFTGGQNIRAMVYDGKYIWAGGNGLARIDAETDEITLYNKTNSGLPDNSIMSLVIDKNKNLWIGTSFCIAKFDRKNWTNYTNTIDGQKLLCVNVLAVDSNNNIWAGTNRNLVRYDGNNWTIIKPDTSNNFLRLCCFTSLSIDSTNTLFIRMNNEFRGSTLATFKDNKWNYYDKYNSNIPDGRITKIYDKQGNIWTTDRNKLNNIRVLEKYNGTKCHTFNLSNSELKDEWIRTIAIDSSGNKWFVPMVEVYLNLMVKIGLIIILQILSYWVNILIKLK